MIDSGKIYSSARGLLQRHGEDALYEASKRAYALNSQGFKDAAAIWHQIMRAIQDLENGGEEKAALPSR